MRIMSNNFSKKYLKRQGFCRFSFYNREWKEKWPGSMSFQLKRQKCKKMIPKTLVVLCRHFFEKVVLKVQGFCTFNIYHGEWEGVHGQNCNQTSGKWFLLTRTLKAEHSGLQVH